MQNSDPQSALFSQISPISGPQPTSAAWRRREMEGTSLSMEGHYRALWAAREGSPALLANWGPLAIS